MIPDLFAGTAPSSGAAWPIPAAGAYTPASDGVKPSGEFADLLAATVVPEGEADVAPQTFAVPVSISDLWLGLMLTAPQEAGARENGATDNADVSEDDLELVPPDAVFRAPISNADPSLPVPVIVQVPTDIRVAAPADVPVTAPAADDLVVASTDRQPAFDAEHSRPLKVAAVSERALQDVERLPSQNANQPVDGRPVSREIAAAAAQRTEAPEPNANADRTPVTTKPAAEAGDGRGVQTDMPAEPADTTANPAAKREHIPAAAPAVPQLKAQATDPSAQQADAPAELAPEIADIAARAFAVREPQAARPNDAGNGAAKADVTIPNVMLASSSQQGDDASQNFGKPSQDTARGLDPGTSTRAADGSATFPAVSVTPAEPVVARPAVQAAAPVETPFTPAQEAENASRLVESMRVQWRQGIPEATVRLNPEHLGEVTISIRVDRGAVSATVHAENPEVQQWLDSQQERLRSGLADQGLNLERFVVSRERERQQQQQQHQQQPRPQARYRQSEEPGPRFEVTV